MLSISLSLVAVFIPLLFMGGQVGRLFREFAVTLSAAVMISLVISLTTTPMMCAWLLQPDERTSASRRAGSRAGPSAASTCVLRGYERSLDWALASTRLVLLHPAGGDRPQRLPVQRRAQGLLPAAGHRPAQRRPARRPEHLVRRRCGEKLRQLVDIIRSDPAVDTVVGFTGGGRAGGGFMFVNLKPLAERSESGQAVIARLRPQLGAGDRPAACS